MSIKIDYSTADVVSIGGTGSNEVKVGINVAPTAYLTLPAGTSATPPLVIGAGTNLGSQTAGAMEFDGYHIYFTGSSTRTQLDGAGGTTYAPASADWWNGKACTDWSKTQAVINRSIGAQGGPGQIVGFSNPLGAQMASGTYNAAYFGCVLAPNGNIYLVPCNQAIQTFWHYIDSSGTIKAYAHGVGSQINVLSANYDYGGGILAPNNRIYLLPLDQAVSSYWHYIDTSTGQVFGYNGAPSLQYGAYVGGAMTSSGLIYLAPNGQAKQSNWHYINTSTASIGTYTNTVGSQCLNYAYFGAALSSNGRIYMIPNTQATQTYWHYIDTDGSIKGYLSNVGSQCVSGAYNGGVLTPNGRIYMMPFAQSKQSYWHYIDTDGTIKAYSNTVGAQCASNAYLGGVLAPNGRIYLIPDNQATQQYWHYIDTDGTIKAYSNTSSAVLGTAQGGALSLNGRIYLTPTCQGQQSTWYYIDTQSDLPLPMSVCTNPMFNKF
jgi:hypothetical protein